MELSHTAEFVGSYQKSTGTSLKSIFRVTMLATAALLCAAALLLATDGNYCGSTSDGGANGDGTLFNTSTSGTYTGLYSFNNTANLTRRPRWLRPSRRPMASSTA